MTAGQESPALAPMSVAKLCSMAMLALVLTAVAGATWSGLLVGNLATTPALPWAAVAMAVLLWLAWQYLDGRWSPRSTSATRHFLLRGGSTPRSVFIWGAAAGMVSTGALVGLWLVMVQLVRIPAHALPDYSRYPPLTVAAVVVTASIAGAVAEEAAFRGYLQGALEARHLGSWAIMVPAIVIAPEHALTQGFLWPVLAWYLLADVMFGTLAYLTKSILPGILVHATGLVIFFAFIWPASPSNSAAAPHAPGARFWSELILTLVCIVIGLLAFRKLKAVVSQSYSSRTRAEISQAPA